MVLTICIILGSGIYAARLVKSAAGFSLGGRSSSAKLVAGAIAGTSIGGGATIGTAQLAFTVGLSAWWFTLGMGIGFLLLGIFFAKPLRRSALETIPQYLVLNYGKSAGPVVSIISSAGTFFACVASVLPGISLLSALLNISPALSAFILMVLLAAYVYFGGMRGASISGLLKSVVIWITLFFAGGIAVLKLQALPSFSTTFSAPYWFSLFGIGTENALVCLSSLIVGVLCTQTYIQSLFSATDAKTASIGAITAAAITIPVGLPSVAIAMFMQATHPETIPILVLPQFLIDYLPPAIGGIALAGIFISIISSSAGMALGIGTMISKDIVATVFKVKKDSLILWSNRISIIGVAASVAIFSLINLQSQVLDWNYLSMALRGGGIFLPLILAIFKPHFLPPLWAIIAMISSTLLAITAKPLFHFSTPPLFVGIYLSCILVIFGITIGKKYNYLLIHQLAKAKNHFHL